MTLMLLIGLSIAPNLVQSDVVQLAPSSQHFRNRADREWSDFPQEASAKSLSVDFDSQANEQDWCLEVRQRDVKQLWNMEINGNRLERLHRDENDIIGIWSLPSQMLQNGTNTLDIRTKARESDDVQIGPVVLRKISRHDYLNQGAVSVKVTDTDTGNVIPCRVTVVAIDGGLQSVGAESNDDMAVRPGVIYCRGVATFGLPAGRFTVFGGRGFEYGIASQEIVVTPGDSVSVELALRREVPTPGLISCDTHVHTFTHSRHGDATVQERMLTIAGEGIELPIATDHNVHIDYAQTADAQSVRQYFTPVIGNEVTTKLGHFNVFPVASSDTPVPDYKASSWREIADSIFATPNVRVAILNHARDIHSGYRPFGPRHHISSAGRNLDGWTLRANAMEIVNSAAQQSDIMRLVHDWMGMLNAGKLLTPVGSSDSHDVSRHFVGQGRTYIRCDDQDPGRIDVNSAVESFVEGRVSVSCGLLADLHVNRQFTHGDLAPKSDTYQAVVRVFGPSWISGTTVDLFANGVILGSREISEGNGRLPGLKATFEFDVAAPQHDIALVAVARGPGPRDLYWPLAKPYQPTSTSWVPTALAVSGAVWIDIDGDRMRTPAVTYAQQICESTDYETEKCIQQLTGYHESVAIHVAALLIDRDPEVLARITRVVSRLSDGPVRRGFNRYMEEFRESQRARIE